MGQSRNTACQHTTRLVALVFGLAAMVVQAIFPICLSGFTVQNGSFSIVLCTAHGVQSVAVDDTGKPVPVPAKDSSDGFCPMCVAFHSAPIVGTVAALLLVFVLSRQFADLFVTGNAPVPRRAYISFITRGPPDVRAALM